MTETELVNGTRVHRHVPVGDLWASPRGGPCAGPQRDVPVFPAWARLVFCATANCSTDIAAKIQWVYPPGECVTDGAISRMAVSCEEIYDYPSLDCTGTPIVNFTGKGECVGIYGVTSMAMNCTPGAGVAVVVNWLLVMAGLLLWQAFV
jgi:hypothetical protein